MSLSKISRSIYLLLLFFKNSKLKTKKKTKKKIKQRKKPIMKMEKVINWMDFSI